MCHMFSGNTQQLSSWPSSQPDALGLSFSHSFHSLTDLNQSITPPAADLKFRCRYFGLIHVRCLILVFSSGLTSTVGCQYFVSIALYLWVVWHFSLPWSWILSWEKVSSIASLHAYHSPDFTMYQVADLNYGPYKALIKPRCRESTMNNNKLNCEGLKLQ